MNLTRAEKAFTTIYIIIVLLELFSSNIQKLLSFHFAPKPLILASLIIFFLNQRTSLSRKTIAITSLALIFSLTGDVFLMFVDTNANFFLIGLISFLLAHIMYIIVFLGKKGTRRPATSLVIILLLFAIGMFYLLKDGLGDMLIPVVIYMLVILSMALAASLRKQKVSSISYNLVFIGALFFIISDSFIALNKFYQAIPYSHIIIMSTYAIAQYLIVRGILKQKQ